MERDKNMKRKVKIHDVITQFYWVSLSEKEYDIVCDYYCDFNEFWRYEVLDIDGSEDLLDTEFRTDGTKGEIVERYLTIPKCETYWVGKTLRLIQEELDKKGEEQFFNLPSPAFAKLLKKILEEIEELEIVDHG
jgi:hypothetical protein